MKRNQSRITKILIIVVIITLAIGCFEVYHYYNYPIKKKVVEKVDGTILMKNGDLAEHIPVSIAVDAVKNTYFFKNKSTTLLGKLRILCNDKAILETELYLDDLTIKTHNIENNNIEPSIFISLTTDLNHILIGAPEKCFLFDEIGDNINENEMILVVASKNTSKNTKEIIRFLREESSAAENWLRENGWQ